MDDATTALHLIDAVDGDIASVTADGAGDSIAICDAAGAWRDRRGASDRHAHDVSAPTRSTARDSTIRKVRAIGRRRWKKAPGYHRQACVENVFFRFKSIIGDGLRARSPAGQGQRPSWHTTASIR